MIKFVLTNKLANALTKKLVGKLLAKKLGVDGKLIVNELYAVENDGRVKLRINVELDVSSEVAESLIDQI